MIILPTITFSLAFSGQMGNYFFLLWISILEAAAWLHYRKRTQANMQPSFHSDTLVLQAA